jgi:hypothetical protein
MEGTQIKEQKKNKEETMRNPSGQRGKRRRAQIEKRPIARKKSKAKDKKQTILSNKEKKGKITRYYPQTRPGG